MAVQPKTAILLGATLTVGFALGLFVDARLLRARREGRRPPVDRRASGFAIRIEDAVQPRSAAQRDSIDVVLQRVLSDNNAVMSTAVNQTRAHTDSLRFVLAPLLDSAQRVRLDSALAHAGRGASTRGYFRFGPPPIAARPR